MVSRPRTKHGIWTAAQLLKSGRLSVIGNDYKQYKM